MSNNLDINKDTIIKIIAEIIHKHEEPANGFNYIITHSFEPYEDIAKKIFSTLMEVDMRDEKVFLTPESLLLLLIDRIERNLGQKFKHNKYIIELKDDEWQINHKYNGCGEPLKDFIKKSNKKYHG